MKYNLISIMRAGAEALDQIGDPYGRAYALHEAANNMILLLNGTDDLDELKRVYTHGSTTPLDLDARFPCEDEDEPASDPTDPTDRMYENEIIE
jgi:hypothetical protein